MSSLIGREPGPALFPPVTQAEGETVREKGGGTEGVGSESGDPGRRTCCNRWSQQRRLGGGCTQERVRDPVKGREECPKVTEQENPEEDFFFFFYYYYYNNNYYFFFFDRCVCLRAKDMSV